MADPHAAATSTLRWYQTLFPYRLDLIQDYAGDEHFIIDGDSLLRHIFSDARIDFRHGFQLLHAVYAVETFLANLKRRKCVFHVLFFDEHRAFCVPPGFEKDAGLVARVEFAREALRQHLEGVLAGDGDGERSVYQFQGVGDEKFKEYQEARRPYFVMCHDGEDIELPEEREERNAEEEEDVETGIQAVNEIEGSNEAEIKGMVKRFMMLGYNVALINHVEFEDSKIYSNVLESHFHGMHDQIVLAEKEEKTPITAPTLPESLTSTRERLTVATIVKLLETEKETALPALYLLHTAFLKHLTVQQRAYRCSEKTLATTAETAGVEAFLKTFFTIAKELLDVEGVAGNGTHDIHDFVDGRLLLRLLMQPGEIPAVVQADFERLAEAVAGLGAAKLTIEDAAVGSAAEKLDHGDSEDEEEVETPKLLAFTNHILDPYLESIKVAQDVVVEGDEEENTEETELYHWVNTNKPTSTKRVLIRAPPPQATGKGQSMDRFQRRAAGKARRKDQKYLNQMTRYAQSLSGGHLAPEKIIADPTGTNQKRKLEKEKEAKESKGKQQQPAKGKKGAAAPKLSKAEQIKLKNAEQKAGKGGEMLLKSWTTVWRELSKSKDEEAVITRLDEFLKKVQKAIPNAKTSLMATETHDGLFIEAEVRLYRIMVLQSMWAKHCREGRKEAGYPLVAHLFDDARKVLSSRGLTLVAKKTLQAIFVGLGIAMPPSPKAAPADKKLNFITKWTGKLDEDTTVEMTSEEFQLIHFGPFMDRNMDSAPDDRVPFEPDGWQRRVLDEIDQDNSVFVVAPTSAGKTFISFHAMKKVLRSDDSGILVYLAPTKALVNQIAAEVISRFNKDYHHQTTGQTVWAIHTRDYRMNKPEKCQILITVPHILSTMLLSPENAKTWAPRLKRIIFDEAHSIGGEDGAVWEQLLLLAPCPIIALSATVGNPGEFSSWLESSQKSHGIKLTMIKHPHRYSDLRKFVYTPSEDESYRTFQRLGKLTKFGVIDGTPGIEYVHPVSALVNPKHGMPDDLTLEARDCLVLWRAMNEFQTKDYPLPAAIDPKKVFGTIGNVITKSQVIVWESQIKSTLRKWIAESDTSPFSNIIKKLGGGRKLSEELELTGIDGVTKITDPDALLDPETTKVTDEEEIQKLTGEEAYIDLDIARTAYLRDKTLPLLQSLHMANALPAILFSYDRSLCEYLCKHLVAQLKHAEDEWRKTDPKWKAMIKQWEEYNNKKKGGKFKRPKPQEGTSKAEQMREEAESEGSFFETFNPEDPSIEFSFADFKKHTKSELDNDMKELEPEWLNIDPAFLHGLRRGIGVHHAGMNRRYRQAVEMLFRKGYLRVVIATGTLSLGINMPCKTVVFAGDSVFLTALNYRQAAGRAGRRGFDLLGNVIFHGLTYEKTYRLISSRLPSLMGHFPISNSLVLRLFILLNNSTESEHAKQMIHSLLTQPRLVIGGESFKEQVLHHLRFSIEFLRRQKLLSPKGVPINFAGITSHLYYVETSAFAFHTLLASGYFGKICKDFNPKHPLPVTDKLMLVLSHIFGRRTCSSRSGVRALPPLPKDAADIIRAQNKETLEMYTTYVTTFAKEYCTKADTTLPFSGLECGGEGIADASISNIKKDARSSFVALSGHTDRFGSIADLSTSVRSGVFVDGASVPYINIDSKAPLNSYLYDFYKHGNLKRMTTEHMIRPGDRWFVLKDFSLELATIVAGLVTFIRDGPGAWFDPSNLGGEEEGGENLDESKGELMVEEEDLDEDLVIERKDKAPEELVLILQCLKALQADFEDKFRNVNA